MVQRDLASELDELKERFEELKREMELALPVKRARSGGPEAGNAQAGQEGDGSGLSGNTPGWVHDSALPGGELIYTGRYQAGDRSYRWEPRTRSSSELLELEGDRAAKVLAAIAHKQRLDILRAVIREPMTGAELVERLSMGTTGQLYHHLKALAAADLLQQEERGGRYTVPGHRVLPLLLLIAAASDLLDASDYLDMAEARSRPGEYLGGSGPFDPHLLLWALFENAIAEHRQGSCTAIQAALNEDGSITLADNGRGIPVELANPGSSSRSQVQKVLTDMKELQGEAYRAPGAGKGIHVAVVNALSSRLSVEVRREGRIYRQDYRFGIPESPPSIVGATKETGTSITFRPDPALFPSGFDAGVIERYARETAEAYPGLAVQVL